MRQLPSVYEDHLNSGATTLCTCWIIERHDGLQIGLTDHDRPLDIDGTVCDPAYGGNASTLQSTSDLAVDNSTIEGVLSANSISDKDLELGRYDGARISIWRVNWAEPDQRNLLKTGFFGEVTRTDIGFTIELRGVNHKLDQVVGRRYQRQCDAILGDAKCGVVLTEPAYFSNGVVISVSGSLVEVEGEQNFNSGWFANGIIKTTSGDADPATLPVKDHNQKQNIARLTLRQPAPTYLKPGDTVKLVASCDRKYATCRLKFSNELNFRGFPHMPGNDAVTRYPVSGENHDGGKRS